LLRLDLEHVVSIAGNGNLLPSTSTMKPPGGATAWRVTESNRNSSLCSIARRIKNVDGRDKHGHDAERDRPQRRLELFMAVTA